MAKEKKAKKKKKKNKGSGFGVLSVIIIVLLGILFLGIGFLGGYVIPGIFFGDDEEKTVVVTEEAAYPLPRSDYELIVNRSNPLEAEFIGGSGELVDLEGFDDVQLETETAAALTKMIADMKFEGLDITVYAGYVSAEDQESLYEKETRNQGGDELKAAVTVGLPLTDENQTGLAVDLTVDGTLSSSFDYSPAGKWLKEHCADYGFILRYTNSGKKVTGVESQPWHFRYVGSPETAKLIMHSGKSMEEYYGTFLNPEDLDPYLPYL